MDKSEKFWNRASGTYDQEEKKDRQTYDKIIEKTKKHLKTSDIVLDYGCGTGAIDIEITGCVKKIYAIDISSGMLSLAKTKTSERNIKNIEFMQAAIWDERLGKESYDVILAFTILHLVEDIPAVVNRIHTLLKPRGLFISSTPCMEEKKFTGILLSLFGKIGLVPDIKSLNSPDLVKKVTDGGFKVIEFECLHQSSKQYFIAAGKI